MCVSACIHAHEQICITSAAVLTYEHIIPGIFFFRTMMEIFAGKAKIEVKTIDALL